MMREVHIEPAPLLMEPVRAAPAPAPIAAPNDPLVRAAGAA